MKRIFHNAGLKTLAIISAFLLWATVVTLQNVPYQFPEEFEVQAFNLPEHLSLAEPLPKSRIRIVASKENRSRVSKKDFEVYVDLKNASEGEFKTEVFVTSKNPNITVYEVSPEEITVNLEITREKTLLVNVVTEGKPAEGFEVSAMEWSPEKIEIKGPKTAVQKAKKIIVKAELRGKEKESFIKKFMAEVVDDKGLPVEEFQKEKNEIEISFEIIPIKKIENLQEEP